MTEDHRERLSIQVDEKVLRGVAHEGRNALQEIYAGLGLLALEARETAEVLNLADEMSSSCDRLRRLFDEMDDYAAATNVEARRCRLRDVWRRAIHALSVECGRGVELREEGSRDPIARGDPSLLEKAFRRLFHWMLESHPGSPAVRLRCSERSRCAERLEGSERSERSERLERLERPEGPERDGSLLRISIGGGGSGTDPGPGTVGGRPVTDRQLMLGLAVARRVVSAHGGRLWILARDGIPAALLLLPGWWDP